MSRPTVNRDNTDERAARRDSLDFRDWIYEPTLVPLDVERLPRSSSMKILDQGEEGACTGFGLAAVINYLIRSRGEGARELVSTRMLYEMAKRHDQWPGESYEGSTARGAMKGWYKNGVCPEAAWPYEIADPGELTPEARESALRYPLGAFYRVLPRRADLQAALHEVDVVFATAGTHEGWDAPVDGLIEYETEWEEQGGHAFAIVGYTEEGFLVQNSWGRDWGGVEFTDGRRYPGSAIWQYGDFDRNLWDAWVARLARPLESLEALSASTDRREEYTRGTPPAEKAPPRATIRDHFIHIDDGGFDPRGDYYTTEAEARDLVRRAVGSGVRDLVLYAHGGLNEVKDCARRVARWRPVFRDNDVHEIHVIWETGMLAELRDMLLGKQDFVERRAGGFGDWRDRWLERITGPLGRGLWREMKTDAAAAFETDRHAGRVIVDTLATELVALPRSRRPRLHLAGHSAGSILLGYLLDAWRERVRADAEQEPRFENLVLLAPACTHAFFADAIKPALRARTLEKLTHFLLDEKTELGDNVGLIYRKSLLYLVSRSYETKRKVVPIMGLAKHLPDLPVSGVGTRLTHFNTGDDSDKTTSKSHGGFDNDRPTMNSLLRIVLGREPRRLFEDTDLSGY